MKSTQELPADYEIREMNDAEFDPLWAEHAEKIFVEDSQVFRLYKHVSKEELEKFRALQSVFKDRFFLNLGVFYKGDFVGWSAGQQESGETYYMRNSAILPEHRRKGLYRLLLAETIRRVTAKGFQKIYSRHSATNNDVIIPKLIAGFTIASLEVSDIFGILVHLVYFPNELRRKMMVYRVGDSKPDDEIKNCLGLP